MLPAKIYLDYNATIAVKPAVIARMVEVMASPFNASSIHTTGREASRLLEEARRQVANAMGASYARVIFTASGTEANNLAANGIKGYVLAVSSIEHVSMLRAKDDAMIIPVNKQGIVDLAALEKMLTESERPLLVSVMLANNETGVIQPIREIADMVHRYNGFLHTDASQAVGKVPVNMADMGVDMLTLSAHKFGGAQGAAALIVAPCIAVEAQIKGGGQELGFRAGTQNLAAIVGMGVAVSLLDENIKAMARIQNYRDRLEKEISLYAPNAIVFGIDAQRLPNTSAVSMPGVNSETQLINCDLNGVAVSAGSACSSGKVARSHVLDAMGMDEDSASSVVRVSMGMDTIEKDIETYIRLWKQLYDRAGEKHSIVDAA